MAIFSMLFGAGVVLMRERAGGWAGLHYRRMGVLWLIGLTHAYLLWDGDILVSYALCGLFLFLFRRARPGRLLISGSMLLAVGSVLSWLCGWSAQYWPPESLAEFCSQWLPSDSQLTEEIAAMQGGWRSEFTQRAPGVLMIHLFYLPFQHIWRAGGCMLLGMALYHWDWFSGKRSRKLYGTLIAVDLLLGLPLTAYGVHSQMAAEWEPVFSFCQAGLFGQWGSLPLALAWIGLVMLLYRSQLWPILTRRLSAVGRMALTNYLLQTIISLLWLHYFRFGPAEWLWRSLSYRRRQPLRK